MRKSRWRFIVAWFGLALSGVAVYVWLRALAGVIYLSTPIYDWQWYLPVGTLIAGLPLYRVWRWLRSAERRSTRQAQIVFAALLVWAVAGYGGFGQSIDLDPDRASPTPISFWAYSDFRHTPEAVLEDLRAAGGRIFLDAGDAYTGERSQALAEAMRRLADYSLDVYLSPPAPNFLSAPVQRDWMASAYRVAEFIRREGLTAVRGVIGDAEPPFNLPLDITGAYREEFSQAVSGLGETIATLHRDHPELQVGVTALWAQYVDRLDGDADLASLLRSPVDPPGGWDFVNLMAYSSYLPADWRAYAVYLQEQAMARLYPAERVSYLIGLIGAGMPWEPVLNFDELVSDARLSRALGVREIAVFQLDAALRVYGDDFVRRLTAAVNSAQPGAKVSVPFARPVSLVLFATLAADALLDLRGAWGWLWIGVSGLIVRQARNLRLPSSTHQA